MGALGVDARPTALVLQRAASAVNAIEAAHRRPAWGRHNQLSALERASRGRQFDFRLAPPRFRILDDFRKEPRALNLYEAAVLAGMVQAPARFNPLKEATKERAHKRARLVLNLMVQQGRITRTSKAELYSSASGRG